MPHIGPYILQSEKNSRYYIGSTNNRDRRIVEHEEGRVSATRYILPVRLKAFIPFDDVVEARRAEYRLKQYKSKKVIDRVVADQTLPWDHD